LNLEHESDSVGYRITSPAGQRSHKAGLNFPCNTRSQPPDQQLSAGYAALRYSLVSL
jgi:hypothetical protein